MIFLGWGPYEKEDLLKHKVLNDNFDEIICVNQREILNVVMDIYGEKTSDVSLVEEGLGSYFFYGHDKQDKIKKIYIHNYLGKILPMGFPENIKFIILDKFTFRDICKIISLKIPLNLIKNKNEKMILITGQYELLNILKNEEGVIEYYCDIIQKLIEKGFKVFFKPHPREINLYFDKLCSQFTDNFQFIDSKLPIEIYDEDFTAVFSTVSGSSISLAHFFNVPSLSDLFLHIYKRKFFPKKSQIASIFIINKYTLNIDCLFSNIDKNTNHEEAKQILWSMFEKNTKIQKNTIQDTQVLNKYLDEFESVNLTKLDGFIVRFICVFIREKAHRKKIKLQLQEIIYGIKNRKYNKKIKLEDNGYSKYPTIDGN